MVSARSATLAERVIAKSRFHTLEVWKRDLACYHQLMLNFGWNMIQQSTSYDYLRFEYSALACFRIGMSGSASFHRKRKSR
jgi:hypothetical protein